MCILSLVGVIMCVVLTACCACSMLVVAGAASETVLQTRVQCSNDNTKSSVHGRIGEGSVCSVTTYYEVESSDHSSFSSLERMCLVTLFACKMPATVEISKWRRPGNVVVGDTDRFRFGYLCSILWAYCCLSLCSDLLRDKKMCGHLCTAAKIFTRASPRAPQ